MSVNSLRISRLIMGSFKNQLLCSARSNPILISLSAAIITTGICTAYHFSSETSIYLSTIGIDKYSVGTILARFAWLIFSVGLMVPSLFFNSSLLGSDLFRCLPVRKRDISFGVSLPFIVLSSALVFALSFSLLFGFLRYVEIGLPWSLTVSLSFFVMIASSIFLGFSFNSILYALTSSYLGYVSSGIVRVLISTSIALLVIERQFVHPFSGSFFPPVVFAQIFKKSYLHLPAFGEQAALIFCLGLAACSHFFFSNLWDVRNDLTKPNLRSGRFRVFAKDGISSLVLLEVLAMIRDKRSLCFLIGLPGMVILAGFIIFLTRAAPPLRIFFNISTQFCLPLLLSSVTFQSENRYSVDQLHRSWPLPAETREPARILLIVSLIIGFALLTLLIAGLLNGINLELREIPFIIALISLFTTCSVLVAKTFPAGETLAEYLQVMLLGILVSIPLLIGFSTNKNPVWVFALFSILAVLLSVQKERVGIL